MELNDFINRAITQDKRNTFGEGNSDVSVPSLLLEFYNKANPIDVEVNMDGNAVRFFPIEELDRIQKEYLMGKERFVFASCNGDPIYVLGDKIYKCCHGTKKIKDEFLAENLSKFYSLID